MKKMYHKIWRIAMKVKVLILNVLLIITMMFAVLGCKKTNEDIYTDSNNEMDSQEGQLDSQDNQVNNDTEAVNDSQDDIVVEPTYGGTIKLAMENATSLSPIDNTNKSVDEVLRLIYEPLFKLDEQLQPVPYLVDSYQYEATNKSLTIKLKPDILFHDGSALTTKDVAYTIDQMKKIQGIYTGKLVNVAYMTIVDDLEMIIYFDENYGFYLYDLCIPIVSKSYSLSDEFDPLVAVGTGAYMQTDFTAMQSLVLDVYEGWHEPLPYVSHIECIIVRDEAVEQTSFEQSLIDVYVPSQLDWRTYSEIAVKPIEYTTAYLDFIGFNFNNILLNDMEFRQAIAYAINREDILSTEYLDHGVITDTLVHPNNYLLSEDDKTLTYDWNTATAETLLANVDFGDSSLEDTTLSLLVNKDNLLRMGMAEMIVDDLASVGIHVIINQQDKEGFYENLNSGNYDLVLTGWKMQEKPDYLGLFDSNYLDLGYNFINYSNVEMDLILESIYKSTNVDILKQNIEKFNKFFISELPYFPIAYINSAILTNEYVYGTLKPTTEDVYNNLNQIYIYNRN